MAARETKSRCLFFSQFFANFGGDCACCWSCDSSSDLWTLGAFTLSLGCPVDQVTFWWTQPPCSRSWCALICPWHCLTDSDSCILQRSCVNEIYANCLRNSALQASHVLVIAFLCSSMNGSWSYLWFCGDAWCAAAFSWNQCHSWHWIASCRSPCFPQQSTLCYRCGTLCLETHLAVCSLSLYSSPLSKEQSSATSGSCAVMAYRLAQSWAWSG